MRLRRFRACPAGSGGHSWHRKKYEDVKPQSLIKRIACKLRERYRGLLTGSELFYNAGIAFQLPAADHYGVSDMLFFGIFELPVKFGLLVV